MIDPDVMQAAPCQADDYVITPEEPTTFFLHWLTHKPKTRRDRFFRCLVHYATWLRLIRPSVMAPFVSQLYLRGYIDGLRVAAQVVRECAGTSPPSADQKWH